MYIKKYGFSIVLFDMYLLFYKTIENWLTFSATDFTTSFYFRESWKNNKTQREKSHWDAQLLFMQFFITFGNERNIYYSLCSVTAACKKNCSDNLMTSSIYSTSVSYEHSSSQDLFFGIKNSHGIFFRIFMKRNDS